MSDKINREIFNSVSENVKALAQLFPSVVKDGEVDFDALKQELGEFVEVGEEKYDFTWYGKAKAKAEATSDILGRTLKLKQGEGVNEDTTQNLYIEGDNLEVLKLLRGSYYGKVKMIYIDPPYNTGTDFVYKDDFSMSDEERLQMEIDQESVDGEGNRLVKNRADNSRYHTNWLNMLYPRLKLARDLLADDGVIFISIDDNEMENLKKICNEIFGEDNFIGDFIWRKKDGGGQAVDYFVIEHEMILVYRKSQCFKWNDKVIQRSEQEFNKEDANGKFKITKLAKWGNTARREDRPSMYFSLIAPDNTDCYPIAPDGNDGRWRVGKERMDKIINEGLLHWENKAGQWIPYEKEYFNNQSKIIKERSILYDVANTGDGTNSLTKLFNAKDIFENPKAIELIEIFLYASTSFEDVVLDFFSGSATTAHAIMQQNILDGGNRRYICVQFPEKTDIKSEAYKVGYRNICEIGKERIRRAGAKIAQEINENNANLKIGEEAKTIPDIGFKVFEVADTNIKMFSNEMQGKELTLEDMIGDNQEAIDFNAGYTDIDVCYELLLRHRGIELCSKVEKLDIGERTYMIADSIVVCLDQKVTENIITALSEIDPLPRKFIFRDSSFGDDISLKRNAILHLNALIEKNSGESKKTYRVEFI